MEISDLAQSRVDVFVILDGDVELARVRLLLADLSYVRHGVVVMVHGGVHRQDEIFEALADLCLQAPKEEICFADFFKRVCELEASVEVVLLEQSLDQDSEGVSVAVRVRLDELQDRAIQSFEVLSQNRSYDVVSQKVDRRCDH